LRKAASRQEGEGGREGRDRRVGRAVEGKKRWEGK